MKDFGIMIGVAKKKPPMGDGGDAEEMGGEKPTGPTPAAKMEKRRAFKEFAKAMASGDWDAAGEAFAAAAEACGFERASDY